MLLLSIASAFGTVTIEIKFTNSKTKTDPNYVYMCCVCSWAGFKKLIKCNLKISTIQNINQIKNGWGGDDIKLVQKNIERGYLAFPFFQRKYYIIKGSIFSESFYCKDIYFSLLERNIYGLNIQGTEDLLVFEIYEWLQAQNMYECLSWNMHPLLKFQCTFLYTYMHGWDSHICVSLSVCIFIGCSF